MAIILVYEGQDKVNFELLCRVYGPLELADVTADA